jgi:hypothetical protein
MPAPSEATALMDVSEEAPAPAPAPRAETAAAARKPEAAAAAPLADLEEARGCAHAVYFSLAMAWGCYYEVFTFFLEETGRMSPDAAAAASTCVVMLPRRTVSRFSQRRRSAPPRTCPPRALLRLTLLAPRQLAVPRPAVDCH